MPLSDNFVRYSVQYKLFIVLYCIVLWVDIDLPYYVFGITVKAYNKRRLQRETDLRDTTYFSSNMALYFYISVLLMKDNLSYKTTFCGHGCGLSLQLSQYVHDMYWCCHSVEGLLFIKEEVPAPVVKVECLTGNPMCWRTPLCCSIVIP